MKLLDCYNYLINLNISLKKADVYSILEKIANKNIDDILINLDSTKFNKKLFKKIVRDLKRNIPVAYILNSKFFYGNEFYVNKYTLIPRPETEILIDEAIKYLEENPNSTVTDICTGSGNIGITIKKIFKNTNVNLIDISKKTLKVAKINSKGLDINLIKGNFIKPLIKYQIKSDVILINPPYIDLNDKNVENSVLINEPNLALFAKDNGLFFYKEIFLNYKNLIKDLNNFLIVMEFGWKQKNDLNNLASELLSFDKVKIEFRKDYSNNWRCIIIKNI